MTPAQSPVSKHRLEALSDGIYAIALTLLVLELKLPALPHPVTDSLLVQALRAIVPKALTWLLSFWIIALFWLAQQRLLRLASLLSPRLSFIELLHLSLISLFPFSTALLGEYARHKPAAVIYAAHLLLIALVSWWRMAYFVGHTELHGPDMSPTVVRSMKARAWLLTGCSLATLCLAFVVPGLNTLAMLPTVLMHRVGAYE